MDNQRMFQNPFSIKGRIRRLEYGLSYLIYLAYYFTISAVIAFLDTSGISEDVFWILLFPMLPAYWFLIAQGTKRCHDRENSGWYQIIPFYALWMLFGASDYGENYYGPNPKGDGNEDMEKIIDEIGLQDQE